MPRNISLTDIIKFIQKFTPNAANLPPDTVPAYDEKDGVFGEYIAAVTDPQSITRQILEQASMMRVRDRLLWQNTYKEQLLERLKNTLAKRLKPSEARLFTKKIDPWLFHYLIPFSDFLATLFTTMRDQNATCGEYAQLFTLFFNCVFPQAKGGASIVELSVGSSELNSHVVAVLGLDPTQVNLVDTSTWGNVTIADFWFRLDDPMFKTIPPHLGKVRWKEATIIEYQHPLSEIEELNLLRKILRKVLLPLPGGPSRKYIL